LLRVMKPVILKVIEAQIRKTVDQLDAQLWDVYQDVQKAAKESANDPDNAQGIFQQYLQAYQRKMLKAKDKSKKAKEQAANTTVNVAVTKQDSIFKNISLPGGISTKATEYKELAAKGDKWQSPVFSIGSARESSDIPKLNPVTRKSHNTASGVVRGGNHPTSGQDTGSGFNPTMASPGRDNQAGGFGNNQAGGFGNNQAGGFGSQVDQAFDNKTNTSALPTTNGVQGSGPMSFYDGVTAR